MKHKRLGSFFILLALCQSASAAPRKIQPAFPVVVHTLIDSPTSEVLDYGSFAFNNRFFSQGGLTPSVSFGVFQRLMFGASMELDNYLGSGNVDAQRPALQLKFRFYDGLGGIPAAAIGYDSQGHRFDKARDKYLLEERGLYLAFSREFLVEGLEVSGGGNISDFEKDALRGFAGFSYSVQGAVGLFGEYDNIRSRRQGRLNAGLNMFFSPFVQMGFSVRDILGKKTFPETNIARKAERIIDIRYITSF